MHVGTPSGRDAILPSVLRKLVCILALLLGVQPALAQPEAAASPQAWQDLARWEHLRRGMSRFDVFRILGEPGKVSSYDGFERWEYPDLLGGRVNFDDSGALLGWRPPRAPRRPPATNGP
jgi:hypothetical protein